MGSGFPLASLANIPENILLKKKEQHTYPLSKKLNGKDKWVPFDTRIEKKGTLV